MEKNGNNYMKRQRPDRWVNAQLKFCTHFSSRSRSEVRADTLTKTLLTDKFSVCLLVTEPIRHVSRFIQWMKRLNLFKKVNDQSENSIRQQRIITRIYLVSLTGIVILSIVILRKEKRECVFSKHCYHDRIFSKKESLILRPPEVRYHRVRSCYSEVACKWRRKSTFTLSFHMMITREINVHSYNYVTLWLTMKFSIMIFIGYVLSRMHETRIESNDIWRQPSW